MQHSAKIAGGVQVKKRLNSLTFSHYFWSNSKKY